LVIVHPAGKENLLADALSRKYKYYLYPPEEQDFIPQSIDPTEDNSNLQDTSITTNNLSISPIPEEITMVSRGCIYFKYSDCDYNKCAGRDESLETTPLVPISATTMTGTMKITKISSKTKCIQMKIPSPPFPKKSLTGMSAVLIPTLLNMIN